MNIKNSNNLKPLTSYQSIKIGDKDPETTSFNDFRLAEYFGTDAINSTYSSLVNNFGNPVDNISYWIELIYILNSLCWMHYNWNNKDYSQLYSDLYYKARDQFLDEIGLCSDTNKKEEAIRMYYDYID